MSRLTSRMLVSNMYAASRMASSLRSGFNLNLSHTESLKYGYEALSWEDGRMVTRAFFSGQRGAKSFRHRVSFLVHVAGSSSPGYREKTFNPCHTGAGYIQKSKSLPGDAPGCIWAKYGL